MFDTKVLLHTTDGRTIDSQVDVRSENHGKVTALFTGALAPNSQAEGENGSIHPDKGVDLLLSPTTPIHRFMAVYRKTEYWCAPAFGTSLSEIPDETQALILEHTDGRFTAVLPVVNDTWKCVLRGTPDGGIAARSFAWCSGLYTCRGLTLVYATGNRVAPLMNRLVKTALSLLGSGIRHREERKYPDIFEYLGWCSWDSMQIRVNEEGIFEKCDEFKSKNIPVKWAIFDDMWAEIHDFYGKSYQDFGEMVNLMHRSAMWNYEADPIRFPQGLAHTIAGVKERGLKVGMWHPTTGYWRGIDPNGPAYQVLKEHLLTLPTGYRVPNFETGHAYLYYKTFHDFFRKAGADFVKIDNQSMTRRYYKGLAPVGQVARSFHDGMEASVGEHFGGVMINCMGMGSEDMWNRTASAVSRTSDDFLPDNKAWFTKHVLQCAFNSVLQGEFYFCDWDMWWTNDGQTKKNSLMRAISGGPIYVSDQLQKSVPEVLAPLALSDGRILRCDRPCVPTSDTLTLDPTTSGKALKLQNMAGEHGIMALLNLDAEEKPVTATLSAEDIDGLPQGDYAVYEHFSRELVILHPGESFDVILQNGDDYRLYIFAPLRDGFASIGRIDKFISPKTIAAVFDKKIQLVEDGPCAWVKDGKLHLSE